MLSSSSSTSISSSSSRYDIITRALLIAGMVAAVVVSVFASVASGQDIPLYACAAPCTDGSVTYQNYEISGLSENVTFFPLACDAEGLELCSALAPSNLNISGLCEPTGASSCTRYFFSPLVTGSPTICYAQCAFNESQQVLNIQLPYSGDADGCASLCAADSQFSAVCPGVSTCTYVMNTTAGVRGWDGLGFSEVGITTPTPDYYAYSEEGEEDVV